MSLEEIIDKLDLPVTATTLDSGDTEIKFENVTEDYFIEVKDEENLWNQYENFDPEEHVLMWLEAKKDGFSGVPDLFTLVEEAKTIDKTLEELAIRVRNPQMFIKEI